MSAPHSAEPLAQPLAEALGQALGLPIAPSALRLLAGGASKQIWSVDAPIAGAPRAVLMRPLGGAIKPDALDLPREHAALAAAHAAGVPTPRPLALLPDLLGQPAALVAWLDGESIGRRIVRDPALAEARARLPAQMAAALAAIHRLDPAGLDLPAPPPGVSPAAHAVAQLEGDLDRLGEPHPAIELGLRWLRRREPPPPARLCVVHGDFRLGNLMVAPDGLAGVLDWEFAHLGDPLEDLAWPMLRDWRFGVEHLRLAGIAPPEPFLAAYAAGAGVGAPDPAAVRYWEVLGNLRWAVGCMNQADRHLSGREPNLEFASLGRRAAEMEREALLLIGASERGE